MHWCGLHREVPSLRPTATRVVSSSSHSPKLGTGRACSQAPDSLLQTARSLTRDLASGALSVRAWDVAQTLASPTFSDNGLLGQEGVDCHALASMSSLKLQPWQHRVLPVGALYFIILNLNSQQEHYVCDV